MSVNFVIRKASGISAENLRHSLEGIKDDITKIDNRNYEYSVPGKGECSIVLTEEKEVVLESHWSFADIMEKLAEYLVVVLNAELFDPQTDKMYSSSIAKWQPVKHKIEQPNVVTCEIFPIEYPRGYFNQKNTFEDLLINDIKKIASTIDVQYKVNAGGWLHLFLSGEEYIFMWSVGGHGKDEITGKYSTEKYRLTVTTLLHNITELKRLASLVGEVFPGRKTYTKETMKLSDWFTDIPKK